MILLVLIAAVVIDMLVALFVCAQRIGAVIGLVVGVGFSFPLQHAIKTKSVHTMQDGKLTFADSPMRYIGVLSILVAGYLFGLLAPWLLE
jgi:hypothetical protein